MAFHQVFCCSFHCGIRTTWSCKPCQGGLIPQNSGSSGFFGKRTPFKLNSSCRTGQSGRLSEVAGRAVSDLWRGDGLLPYSCEPRDENGGPGGSEARTNADGHRPRKKIKHKGRDSTIPANAASEQSRRTPAIDIWFRHAIYTGNHRKAKTVFKAGIC